MSGVVVFVLRSVAAQRAQNLIEVLPLDRRSRRDLRCGYFVHGHHMSGVVVSALGSVAAQRAPKP
jgi:hypothetical protein